MDYYIKRLVNCGYSYDDAKVICRAFLEDHSVAEFMRYIAKLEMAKNVD